MAFNQQNLSPGTAFFRFMLGSVMTTYGTVRLLHEPKSRSGKMLVLFGSMKAAEGATKFCPTKAIGTVMDNLANENAKSGAQGSQTGQYASGGNTDNQHGGIMQMVGSLAQKLTNANSSQNTSGSQNAGGNQTSNSADQSNMGSNSSSISNLAQTIAPQLSQAVKEVTNMASSQQSSGTKNEQKQASGTSEGSSKKNATSSGNNSKSASSTNNKQAAPAKANTDTNGKSNNSNIDSSIIVEVSKSSHKNSTTPNILQ
ncbi:MAG: hypothetical protein WAM41_16470 [Psychrobacillus psychrotolerans]|uniref:hypothetical protein n=1 Tax=Psychrobacillus psychrotolerans TaxID=126156 RepID=UPI003BAF51AD